MGRTAALGLMPKEGVVFEGVASDKVNVMAKEVTGAETFMLVFFFFGSFSFFDTNLSISEKMRKEHTTKAQVSKDDLASTNEPIGDQHHNRKKLMVSLKNGILTDKADKLVREDFCAIVTTRVLNEYSKSFLFHILLHI